MALQVIKNIIKRKHRLCCFRQIYFGRHQPAFSRIVLIIGISSCFPIAISCIILPDIRNFLQCYVLRFEASVIHFHRSIQILSERCTGIATVRVRPSFFIEVQLHGLLVFVVNQRKHSVLNGLEYPICKSIIRNRSTQIEAIIGTLLINEFSIRTLQGISYARRYNCNHIIRHITGNKSISHGDCFTCHIVIILRLILQLAERYQIAVLIRSHNHIVATFFRNLRYLLVNHLFFTSANARLGFRICIIYHYHIAFGRILHCLTQQF